MSQLRRRRPAEPMATPATAPEQGMEGQGTEGRSPALPAVPVEAIIGDVVARVARAKVKRGSRPLVLKTVLAGIALTALTLTGLAVATTYWGPATRVRRASGGLEARWMIRTSAEGPLEAVKAGDVLTGDGSIILLTGGPRVQVLALRAGKVIFSDEVPGFGYWVTVESNDPKGLLIHYSYLEAEPVAAGKTLVPGEQVGTTGYLGNGLDRGVMLEAEQGERSLPLNTALGVATAEALEGRLFGADLP